MGGWKQVLADAGYRVTRPRKVVVEVLGQAEVPLGAQEICELGRALHPDLGLVTVYRTLDLLEELGLACRVHLNGGCHGYLASVPGHRHRLLCERCGRSIEFLGRNDLDVLIANLEAKTGYRIHEHLLQLLGLCPECQAQR